MVTIIVNSTGFSYSTSTTATLDSSVGSGATFKVNTTGNKLPDYPSTCTQYDQRRVFAGSSPHPLKCWFTNAGKQDLMCYHLPVLDDDRIEIESSLLSLYLDHETAPSFSTSRRGFFVQCIVPHFGVVLLFTLEK